MQINPIYLYLRLEMLVSSLAQKTKPWNQEDVTKRQSNKGTYFCATPFTIQGEKTGKIKT